MPINFTKLVIFSLCTLQTAAAFADSRLLVALEGGGIVQLEATTGKVMTQSSSADSFGVVFSADGKTAYATDKSEGTLLILNTSSGAVTGRLSLGKHPQQPALTDDGRLLIPMSGEGAVFEVDINRAPQITRRINIGQGSKPHIVAISPDKRMVWVTVQGIDPRVVSIDLANSYQAKDYRYDLVPRVIASFDGGAYFTAHHSTGLHRVDLTNGTISTPFMDQFGSASEARKQIEGIATSKDGQTYAITHEGRKALIAIKVQSGQKCEVPNLANKPYWVTLSQNGKVAYISIPDAGLVEAYDIDTCLQKPLWSVKVGGKAKRMDVY